MRVIDENCLKVNEPNMVKKKKRTVKVATTNDENNLTANENSTKKEKEASFSEEFLSDGLTTASNGIADDQNVIESSPNSKKCVHQKSAINATLIRKKFKQLSKRCENCETYDENDVVWLCLCCGHRGCGRYSTNQHALKHFETPRSVQHSLVFNLHTSQIWCYVCDDEINSEIYPVLKQLSSDLKKVLSNLAPESTKPSKEATKKRHDSVENNQKSKSTKEKSENLPPSSIKGLSNLGNTCFFNSVLQNLIQTHQLDEILDSDRLVKGANVVLRPSNGPDHLVTPVDSPNEEDHKLHEFQTYPPLTITLNADLGNLTQSLCSIFKEFKTSKNSVLTPSSLFGQVCKKAPRFKGFQQQDSHELLRYLLDALRDEEQRRLRLALLQNFDLPKVSTKETLSQAEKLRLKAYDRAADVTCVEQVFGGQLVQHIKCLECGKISQKLESFLDLSLPIVENNKNCTTLVNKLGEDFMPALSNLKNATTKSKHMIKKEKNVARKKAKGVSGRRKSSDQTTDAEPSTPDVPAAEGTVGSVAEATVGNAAEATVTSVAEVLDGLNLDVDENDSKLEESNSEEVQEKDKSPDPGCQQSDGGVVEPLSEWVDYGSPDVCHLTLCLRGFMSPEKLTDKNKFGCEFCSKRNCGELLASNTNNNVKNKVPTVYTDAVKQYLIYSPPAVLTLHLKRFHQVGGALRKISKHVEFPLVLNLSPYCSKDGKRHPSTPNAPILYSLYGIVSHSGRLSGGHYVAYVKEREKNNKFLSTFLQQSGPANNSSHSAVVDINRNLIINNAKDDSNYGSTPGRWYYVSDSHFSEVAESKLLNSEAYLLFYERIQ